MARVSCIWLALVMASVGCARTPIPPALPTDAPPAQQSPESQLLDLIDNAIEAHGGEHRLERLKIGRVLLNVSLKSTEGKLIVEEYLDLPRRYRRMVSAQDGDRKNSGTYLVVGNQGWRVGGDGKVNRFEVGRIEDAFFSFILDLIEIREQDYRLSPLSDVDIAGRPALGIQVNYDGEWVADLYLDKEKFWLLRTKKNVQPLTADKKMPVTSTYAEFKEFDGVRLPVNAKVQCAETEYDVIVRDFQWMQRADRKVFTAP